MSEVRAELYNIILAPHVSEKSTNVSEASRQFVFKVDPRANKKLVKDAVEAMFKVKVDNVSILNMKGKQKRFGGRLGQRKLVKKAYVTLSEGFDIDFTGIKE